MRAPDLHSVLRALANVAMDATRADPTIDEVEVRLWMTAEDDWTILWGDPSFDLDHRGFWGFGTLYPREMSGVVELASDLIDQVEDAIEDADV